LSDLTVSSIGERALINRITARLSCAPWIVVGPGDDAAVLEPERGALEVVTTDALVDGVHFDTRFVPPDAAGHRALAVNLSDLAAMGAMPRAALLSLLLPDTLEVAALDRLLDGLLALADRQRVTVVGGNIACTSGPLAIDVTAIGTVRRRRVLTRAGARPGDEVYVTGTLGDAAVGLARLRDRFGSAGGATKGDSRGGETDAQVSGPMEHCEQRYLRPEPRVRAGMLLGRNRAASSCIDLSDGLADGVRQLARASGVGITIDAAAIPVSEASRRWHAAVGRDPIETALVGGDDYELLFTVRPAHRGRLRAVLGQLGKLPVTRVGVVTRDPAVLLRGDTGVREMPAGYEHFRLRAGGGPA
jgi:thiamine-monophosphate kinase